MNVRVYSLHWDNVDPAIVAAQKSVFDHFGIPVNQHRIDQFDHGEWIDWVMARMEDVDVFLFIDIDCIPLSREKITEGIKKAAEGVLYGAEGAANHIQPFRSYAAPWYVFIGRRYWKAARQPSARATPFSDVGQLWTDMWQIRKFPVELIAPTACIEPKWDLPGRPKCFGIGTTYGEDCFHLFESYRSKGQHLLDRSRKVIGRG